ncbi:MAG TPA: MarR family transcriptional regulator [Phnomibacter sp.]|nr:MarR family transcriptional regulator [Phnomibacter sp.]
MKLEQAIQTRGFKTELHKAVVHLLFTAYHIKSRISSVLKNYALTHEQFNVLRILRGSYPEPLCVKDIACRMIERNSNVPRIIDRLVVKKLVKRTTGTEDRRETTIHITQAGLNLLQTASEAIELAGPAYMALTEEQAANLNKLLEQVLPE